MTPDLPPDHTPTGASTGAGNAAAPPEVQVMFDRIAGRYDLMNLLISAFQEPRWRRRLVTHAALQPGGAALDVASGPARWPRTCTRGCSRSGASWAWTSRRG